MSTIVPAPEGAPFDAVVGLLAVFADGSVRQFSGALVAPDEVLTAAHGVWAQGLGAAIAVVALPEGVPLLAGEAGTEPLILSGTYATDWHFNPVQDANNTLTAAQSQSDEALVHFGAPLSGATPFRLATAALPGSTAAQAAGLPSAGAEQTAGGTVTPSTRLGVLTGLVTLGAGSSGGPIWVTGADGAPTIVGTISTTAYAAEVTSGSAAQVAGWEAQDAATGVGGGATGTAGGLYTLTGTQSVLTSLGPDTIQASAATGVIYAAGPSASILGGGGALVVVGGGGSDTVRPGSGSATLYGGSGGGVFDAGRGGGSVLVAGGGACTLVGGGNGDALFGAPANPDLGRAGQGTEMAGGAGQEVIVCGTGGDTVTGGTGTTTAFAGTGRDVFAAYGGLGGTLAVVGFKPTDILAVAPENPGSLATVTGAYGTTISFDGGSSVVLFGVSSVPNVQVF